MPPTSLRIETARLRREGVPGRGNQAGRLTGTRRIARERGQSVNRQRLAGEFSEPSTGAASDTKWSAEGDARLGKAQKPVSLAGSGKAVDSPLKARIALVAAFKVTINQSELARMVNLDWAYEVVADSAGWE